MTYIYGRRQNGGLGRDMGGWRVNDMVAFVEKPTSIHAPPKMESSPN
jgi:hypothetical protein